MKKFIGFLIFFHLICFINVYAQVSGNIAYQDEESTYEKPTIELGSGELNLEEGSFLIEASVLINAKADEYVATFSLSEEGKTVDETGQKIERRISSFVNNLASLGINKNSVYVDFITQNKIYGYDLKDTISEDTLIKERLTGFEIKKNILIRYKNKELLNKIVLLAAKSNIYDVVKLDYVINSIEEIRKKLFDEAIKVANKKEVDFINKLKLKISSKKEVYTIKYTVLNPSESYQSYQASETNEVIPEIYQGATIEKVRKSKTFFYNPFDSKNFDYVINPVIAQPVVQYAILLKLKCKLDN